MAETDTQHCHRLPATQPACPILVYFPPVTEKHPTAPVDRPVRESGLLPTQDSQPPSTHLAGHLGAPEEEVQNDTQRAMGRARRKLGRTGLSPHVARFIN